MTNDEWAALSFADRAAMWPRLTDEEKAAITMPAESVKTIARDVPFASVSEKNRTRSPRSVIACYLFAALSLCSGLFLFVTALTYAEPIRFYFAFGSIGGAVFWWVIGDIAKAVCSSARD